MGIQTQGTTQLRLLKKYSQNLKKKLTFKIELGLK
jgi:hypothetical protein